VNSPAWDQMPRTNPERFRPAVSGFHWRSVGPAAAGGRILRVMVLDSGPATWFISSASDGVWKTTNSAVTFEPLFQHESTISIGDITVYQNAPNIVWVGTGENHPRNSTSLGDGICKSIDGGATWTKLSDVAVRPTSYSQMGVDPSNDQCIYTMATRSHRSGDGGTIGEHRAAWVAPAALVTLIFHLAYLSGPIANDRAQGPAIDRKAA